MWRRTLSRLQQSRFQSHSQPPGGKESVTQKTKNEAFKMLKMQMVLVPVVAVGMLWMYPPMSAEDERKAREAYEKNAGWKS